MQKDKYAKVQPRPTKAAPINITPEFIHPAYELKSKPISLGTDTGHLEIFRLEPTNAGQPTFSARWDWKPNTIDIDLIGDEDASRQFKAGSGDYKGHHSITLCESPLTFHVDIQTPAGKVFQGKVEVGIELTTYLRDNMCSVIEKMTDSLRILAKCPSCGIIEFSGPPFVLDRCPKCHGDLRSNQ